MQGLIASSELLFNTFIAANTDAAYTLYRDVRWIRQTTFLRSRVVKSNFIVFPLSLRSLIRPFTG